MEDADLAVVGDGGAMMRPRPVRHLTAAAVLLAALTVAGCGEDEPPAICSSVDSLQASVEAVTTVDLGEGALAELQDNLDQVQSDLSQVRDDAGEEYAGEIDAVDRAFTSISSSVEAGVASPSAQAVTEVGIAIESLGTALSDLEEAVRSTC